MNVFLVSAIHQLQQVNSAVGYFHLNTSNTQILYFSFDKQDIPSHLLPLGFNYTRFSNWVFRDLLNGASSSCYYMNFLKRMRNNRNFNLYTSQYFSDSTLLAISILKPSKVYIMDEGTASFRIAEYRAKHVARLNLKLLFKSILYKSLILYPKSVIFYTQYNFEIPKYDSILKYSFKKIYNSINIEKGYIIVLGSSISEVGVVSQPSYLELLERIIKRHNGYRFDYFPHRKESNDLIRKVEGLGYKIQCSNMPFESAYATLDPHPELMYSFISPVFDNISKQYSKFPALYIVEIPRNMYLDLNIQKTYEQIYCNYRSNNEINVVAI